MALLFESFHITGSIHKFFDIICLLYLFNIYPGILLSFAFCWVENIARYKSWRVFILESIVRSGCRLDRNNYQVQAHVVDVSLLFFVVISLCHQYRARPDCIPSSLTRLYTVGWPTSSSHLDIPKIIMNTS